ncbi:alpha/beta hydrolase [Streptomyces sp. NPDC006879]|uniref:alpha/beta hydrolase n=1 Tax=Streptomyces sp. NPDC006879 TaxID=3364767 RepID=UPI0036C9D4D1
MVFGRCTETLPPRPRQATRPQEHSAHPTTRRAHSPQTRHHETENEEVNDSSPTPQRLKIKLGTLLSCYGRPAGTDYLRTFPPPKGAPRMLLVGTRGDPATPYRWTEETAARLGPAAVVLDYRGEGHGAYSASPCVRGHVDAFLIDGRLPSGTRSCPADQ